MGVRSRAGRFLTSVWIFSCGVAAAQAQTKDDSLGSTLSSRFEGVELRTASDGAVAIFARPMTSGSTPRKAAEAFLNEHGSLLGAQNPDLRLTWSVQLGSGKGTAFAYQQFVDGLPVEHGIGRVLVSSGPDFRVIYAAGRLVDGSNLPSDQVAGSVAADRVRTSPEYFDLVDWSTPELVVYAGEPDTRRSEAARAWKFTATSVRGAQPRAFTFFVRASDARLLHARNEIYHGSPISGRVTALATPGVLPDTPLNPPVEMPVRDLFVRDLLGNLATTDTLGDYVLFGDGAPTELSAMLAGPFCEVRDLITEVPLLSQSASPPGPAEFLFNTTPSEASTAQVNAMIHSNETRAFYAKYQPDFHELDVAVAAYVNQTYLECNAFYTPVGHAMNYFASGGRCVNTAYSSVVNHEYGHFVVNQLEVFQGAFGEGFSDCVAILMQDDPLVGADFFGPGTFVRDTVAANQQYPCFGEIHLCGQLLAGVWWDIKLNLQSVLGDDEGLEYARQLFTDWSMITLGGRLRNSAHPGTAIEALTVDDDDGNLGNGTPHQEQICAAFNAHSIACPGQLDCGSLRLRASCRRGTVSASVATGPATSLVLTLQGDSLEEVITNRFGRASVQWRGVESGPYEVCVQGCQNSCVAVDCR